MATIGVVGATGWGTTLAIITAQEGHSVRLLARSSQEAARLRLANENSQYLPGASFHPAMRVTHDPPEALGSIVAATLGAITLAVIALMNDSVPLEYALYGAVGAAIILFKHRDNIQRLLRGDERKLGQKVDTVPGPTDTQRGKGLRWPRSA